MHQAFGLPAGVVTYTDEEGDKIALDSEGEGEEGRVSFTCTVDVYTCIYMYMRQWHVCIYM